jgi:hypothetical protein
VKHWTRISTKLRTGQIVTKLLHDADCSLPLLPCPFVVEVKDGQVWLNEKVGTQWVPVVMRADAAKWLGTRLIEASVLADAQSDPV